MKVWATFLVVSILISMPCTADPRSTNEQPRDGTKSELSEWLSETEPSVKRFSGSLKSFEDFAGQLSEDLQSEPPVPAAEKPDNIALALDLINRQVKPLIELSGNQPTAADGAGDSSARGAETTKSVTYWKEVPRELPLEESANKPKMALLRFRRHVINAVACAERTLECQRRADVAIDRYEAAWAVKHLDAALYLSWRGRQELREARKEWNVAISEMGEWFERFDAQTSGSDVMLEQRFAEWQVKTRRDGLANEYVAALRKAGYLPHEIDRHKARLLGYDVRETARIYSQFRSLLPALKERLSVDARSDHNFLEDRIWTNLCYIWASALEKFEQTGIALELEGVADKAAKRYSGWCVVPAGAPANELLRRPVLPTPKPRNPLSLIDQQNSEPDEHSGPLVPGSYDVYLILNQPEQKQPLPVAVRVAQNVQVKLGRTTNVSAAYSRLRTLGRSPSKSGVRIEVGDGQSLPHRWFLVEHGAEWTTMVGQPYENAQDRKLVAPGKYDVYLAEHDRQPLLFARAVTVKENHWTAIDVNSSLRLDVADCLPSLDYYGGRWGVVRAGGNPNQLLHWAKSPGSLRLPVGTYDVYWKHSGSHEPMLLAENVQVQPGKRSTVRTDSGLHLKAADWVPRVSHHHGWWGVVPAGGNPKNDRLHWAKSPSELVLSVGTYDLYWKQDYHHAPLLLAANVKVKRGKLVTVRIDSGINLEVAEGVPQFGYYGHWGVVHAGDSPEVMLHWSKSPGHLLLPPGKYDVYWKQRLSREPRLVESGVTLEHGTVKTIRVEQRP